MSYALIAGTNVGASTSNPTTAGVDTTGADLLVVSVAFFNPGQSSTAPTVSDNKSNTWFPLTVINTGANSSVAIYYAKNPTVGSGHTFSVVASFATISVSGFSGADISSPFDVENGAGQTSGSTIQPGSITPNQNNELVISAIDGAASTSLFAIDSGFTILVDAYQGTNNFNSALAYKIQTSASAVNPTWTMQVSGQAAAAIASFKAAAGGPTITMDMWGPGSNNPYPVRNEIVGY